VGGSKHVFKPPLVPKATYTLLGFTALIYFTNGKHGNLFISLAPGIDDWGHVGGLLDGAIFAWFADLRWEVVGIYPVFIYRIKVNCVRRFGCK